MNPETLHLQAIWAALAAAAIAGIGEWLHARRIARVQALAFGPVGRPRRWTLIAPACRVIGMAGLAWSLVTLLSFDRLTRERDGRKAPDRHLMVLLDVSPSMLLKDAGESRTDTRNARASAVLKSVLDRIPGDRVRFSATGFYTEARPLVKECQDRELLLHLVGGTPFHITYKPGKTDILKSLNQVGTMMKDWERKSTTLLVISDGDSVPPTGLNPMPSSVAEVIFAGVGNSSTGTFIDGHVSRQDTANMSQLARRLHGAFYDCNVRQVPSEALKKLNAEDTGSSRWKTDRRFLALVALAASSGLLCLLPLALEYLGSAWRPRPAPLRNLQPRTVP
ncbi:MAG: VWA domain-containing protein [Luteolibacter sp.]